MMVLYCVQVSELQRKMSELKEAMDESCTLAEGLVAKRMGKEKYISQDKSNQTRINRLTGEIKTIVLGLD